VAGSNAAGGAATYSYFWEWCAIDCYGGGNTVSNGWNVFESTDPTIYWAYVHPVTIRSTVTDASQTQAVTTYYIP
jgi:hypothetical protein